MRCLAFKSKGARFFGSQDVVISGHSMQTILKFFAAYTPTPTQYADSDDSGFIFHVTVKRDVQ